MKHKGPDMFVERCVFLKKNIKETKLLESLMDFKPLNYGKLNSISKEIIKEKS